MGLLMKQDLEYLLDIARQAARLGAEKIKDIYQQYLAGGNIGIREKGKDDPVTAADMAANQIITQKLKSLLPEHAIFTEEEPDTWDKTGSEWVWMIDPLDGTRDFIKANGEFVTMVGLTHFGEPIIGVVIEPATGLELYACKGLGAYKSWLSQGDKPLRLRISDTTDMKHLRLAVSRSQGRSQWSLVERQIYMCILPGGQSCGIHVPVKLLFPRPEVFSFQAQGSR
jgi:3'(2'), 5'-bisphosphate nucleotidase